MTILPSALVSSIVGNMVETETREVSQSYGSGERPEE